MENKVIKFANGMAVIVILEVAMHNQKYVYCTKLDDKQMPTKEFVTYKVVGNEFIEVDDELELQEISRAFYNKMVANLSGE